MANLNGILAGKKTYIVSVTAIITAITTYLTGDASLADSLQLVVTALLGATIRNGIK